MVCNLVEHYFDIETTGLEPEHDKIITIQIQKLVGRTGEPIGEIDILKEKLLKLRGETISVIEYEDELSSYANAVNQVFAQFIAEVSLMNDPHLLERAEHLSEMARTKLVEGIEEISEKKNKEIID